MQVSRPHPGPNDSVLGTQGGRERRLHFQQVPQLILMPLQWEDPLRGSDHPLPLTTCGWKLTRLT